MVRFISKNERFLAKARLLLEERLTITSDFLKSFLKDSRIKSSPLLEVRFISKNERFMATKDLAIAGVEICFQKGDSWLQRSPLPEVRLISKNERFLAKKARLFWRKDLRVLPEMSAFLQL